MVPDRDAIDTIGSRTIVVLLFALVLSHLAALAFYRHDLLTELGLSGQFALANRINSIHHQLEATPMGNRDALSHTLSGTGIEIHWSKNVDAAQLALQSGKAFPDEPLAKRLREGVPVLAYGNIVVADRESMSDTVRHLVEHAEIVSSQLSDGSWVNYTVTQLEPPTDQGLSHLLMSTGLMVGAVLLVSIVLIRAWTAPLRRLEEAADRFGADISDAPILEAGPREVRRAARAFNRMQARIRRLLADHTQFLAAVGHDLRTPITHLRLRTDYVDDDEQRRKMLVDLDDMEAMISSILEFLSEEASREKTKLADLTAILETVCGDMVDAGHEVVFSQRDRKTLRCRPLALKRAFSNLIDNAIKYGGGAIVSIEADQLAIRIIVDDKGPGIPEGEWENVFRPFYRVEGSRNRETGGNGLGLAVTRSIISAHGGEIILQNLKPRGLRVIATMPVIHPTRSR